MKGSALDGILIIGLALFLGVFILFFYTFFFNLNAGIQGLTGSIFTEQFYTTFQTGTDAFLLFDEGFIILTFSLMLGSWIGAAFVRTHPIFFVVFFILTIMDLIFAANAANIFLVLAGTPTLSVYANMFPYMVTFFQNMPLIILGYLVTLAIILYSFGGGDDVRL